MSDIKSFRDLDVWRRAMDLTTAVYKLTNDFPRHELFGMTTQMRRSAVSIPANVAEGHNRRVNGPYRNHVGIAMGSQGELDTLLELAIRLGYSSEGDLMPTRTLTNRVGQMLGGLYRSLDNQDAK